MLINKNLPQKSTYVAAKLAAVALLALSLVFQTPVGAVENGGKAAVKAKAAAKKHKAVGKAHKSGAKVAKAAKAKTLAKKQPKHAHVRKAAAKAHAGKSVKVARKQAVRKPVLAASKIVAPKAAAPQPIKPASVAVAKPAIAKPARTPMENTAVATENSLPPPEFRIATSACQRDGKVYLMAGCDNKELPDVLTANSTKVDAR